MSRPMRTYVHKEKFPEWTMFIDTETITVDDEGHQEMIVCCYEIWKSSIMTGLPDNRRDTNAPFRRGFFTHKEQFYQFLKDFDGSVKVVAHHMAFDADVLQILNPDYHERYGFDIDPGNSILSMDNTFRGPFKISFVWDQEDGKDKKQTQLVCNTNYYKSSLKEIGESFGIEKKELPGNRDHLIEIELDRKTIQSINISDSKESERLATTEDKIVNEFILLLAYCKRDVEILRESWFSIYQFSQDIASCTPGLTAASMTKRIFQRRFFKCKKSVVGTNDKPEVMVAEVESYRGGRSDTFWKGKPRPQGKIYKYDVNSMYPFCMSGYVPIQFHREMNEILMNGEIMNKEHCPKENPGIYLAEVTLDIPKTKEGFLGLAPYQHEERGIVFPVGEFRTWLWEPEYEIAYRNGWVKEVHHAYRYHSYPLFANFMGTIYNYRQKAKSEGKKAQSYLFKLIMNSLYGKFGQKKYEKWGKSNPNELEVAKLDQKDRTFWEAYKPGTGMESRTQYLNTRHGIWESPRRKSNIPHKDSVFSIAGYITSAGRAYLWLTMDSILKSGGTLFACDTDSIMTDSELDADYVGEQMGQWKLEDISDPQDCEFFCPKHYEFDNKATIKGAKNPLVGIKTYDQYHFSNIMAKFRTKSMEVRKGPTISLSKKVFAGTNNKRKEPKKKNGPTYPLHVNDL